MLIGVSREFTDEVLRIIKRHKYGHNAKLIGQASEEVKRVVLQTSIGGKRIIEAPAGDPVPRIC
jgi:hydrogenase expression/formation protein HypE